MPDLYHSGKMGLSHLVQVQRVVPPGVNELLFYSRTEDQYR